MGAAKFVIPTSRAKRPRNDAILMTVVLLLFGAFGGVFALLASLFALALSVLQWHGLDLDVPSVGKITIEALGTRDSKFMFGGMLLFDHVTLLLRCFLYGFTALVVWLSMLTGKFITVVPTVPEKPEVGSVMVAGTSRPSRSSRDAW